LAFGGADPMAPGNSRDGVNQHCLGNTRLMP
jgi:hypothetical protein